MSGQSLAGRIALTILSVFGFGFALLLLSYAVSPWLDRLEIPFTKSRIYDSAAFGPLALCCVVTTVSLIRGKKWAWFIAFGASALFLVAAIVLFVGVFHMTSVYQQTEAGAVFGFALLLLLVGGTNFILLSLPFVRRRYFHRATDPY
jgi:hypothetical protein